MYTTSCFEPFNFLINTLLADSGLLPFEPVIAGGFPTALFLELKQIDSADGWCELADSVKKDGVSALTAQFGDIDFYFLGDSPLWQSEHRWLVSDYLPSRCASSTDNPFGLVKPKPYYYSSWGMNYIKNHTGQSIQYQLMRNPYFSVEDCIKDFDLLTCCIAWQSGRLIFHDSYEEAFDRKEVAINPPGFERIWHSDIYTRLFTILRAFKYCHRLGFTLSDELVDYCSVLHSETHSIDLDSESPLRNRAGEITSNPVPSSKVFRRLVERFWCEYEKLKNGVEDVAR